MNSAMQLVQFAVVEFLLRMVLVLVGLGALLLAYIGTLIVGVPRKGRGFSTAFVHALPLAIVVFLLALISIARDVPEDVGSSSPCHLTGNYSLMMVDSDSPGWVYKDTHGFQNIDWTRDGIDPVKSLQVAGRYIVGGRDARGFQKNAVVNEYFLIDTETATLTRFPTRSQLDSAVTPLGIRVDLEPAYGIYAPSQQSESRGFVVLICLLGMLFRYLCFRWVKKLKSLRPIMVAI